MSYVLGGVTLPQPKKFTRTVLETLTENTLIYGKTTRSYRNTKEQYTLEFYYLPLSTINAILALYELGEVLTFTVTETGLSIDATQVLMDVSNLNFPAVGEGWREDFVLTLTEVI